MQKVHLSSIIYHLSSMLQAKSSSIIYNLSSMPKAKVHLSSIIPAAGKIFIINYSLFIEFRRMGFRLTKKHPRFRLTKKINVAQQH